MGRKGLSLLEQGSEPKPSKTFEVEVDYDDPAHRQIVKGDYSYVDPGLTTEHFPIRGKGKAKKTFEYVEFDRDPTTQEALDELKRRGLERPDFPETRAFHKANPEERNMAPVISLCGGFVGRGGLRCVACLGGHDFGFHLSFNRLDHWWDRDYRFLAVRK